MSGSAAPASLSAADLVVFDSEPGAFVFAGWKNVLVVVWRTQATGPSVERFARACEIMAARHPGLRSNVHLIAHGAGLPTPEARAGFVRLMVSNEDSLACVAIVIGGSGFLASAVRSAMTGLRLLSPRSFDFRLFGTSEEVARWLPAAHEKKSGVTLEPAELLAALDVAVSTAPGAPDAPSSPSRELLEK